MLFGTPEIEVRVYSASNVFLGMTTTPAAHGFYFIGVWSPEPIGRINIYDPANGSEGADNIQAWDIAPPPCPGDLNDDGDVNAADLAVLLGAWGPNPSHPADLNDDGNVNAADLAVLLGAWGPCV